MNETISFLTHIPPEYALIAGILGSLVYGSVQALKNVHPFFEQNAMVASGLIAFVLAALVVLDQMFVIAVLVLTEIIAAKAAGNYSWSKGNPDVLLKLEDYSDET